MPLQMFHLARPTSQPPERSYQDSVLERSNGARMQSQKLSVFSPAIITTVGAHLPKQKPSTKLRLDKLEPSLLTFNVGLTEFTKPGMLQRVSVWTWVSRRADDTWGIRQQPKQPRCAN